MYKEKEYGFLLTDKNNSLTIDKYNENVYNIREFCFAISSYTVDYSLESPLALAMNWRGSLCATIYSDSKMTYFGIYHSDKKEITLKADVSDFNVSGVWLSRFLARCERRIIERKHGNISATVQEEILSAWNNRLKMTEQKLPSNIPCRKYEVPVNTIPSFIETEEELPLKSLKL